MRASFWEGYSWVKLDGESIPPCAHLSHFPTETGIVPSSLTLLCPASSALLTVQKDALFIRLLSLLRASWAIIKTYLKYSFAVSFLGGTSFFMALGQCGTLSCSVDLQIANHLGPDHPPPILSREILVTSVNLVPRPTGLCIIIAGINQPLAIRRSVFVERLWGVCLKTCMSENGTQDNHPS